MDSFLRILFWISFFLVGYCYLGYGLVALLFLLFKGRKKEPAPVDSAVLPSISLVITAFQEAGSLQKKLENIRALDYPASLLKVLLVIDEPDERSQEILKGYPAVNVLIQSERTGKYIAICRAMELVDTPIVVFSDANCVLNRLSLKKMVSHFKDPNVGAVAGEKKIIYQGIHSALGQAEGWYWNYESWMKKLDAGLYTVVGAAGELFSIRKELFQPIGEPVILDDLVISLQICLQGYRIAYEPGAFASELPSATLKEEGKRKIRIAAGAFQSLHLWKDILHPFKFPLLWFQFISRRIFRWVISPVFLSLILITNIFIVITGPADGFYFYFLCLQALCYLLAVLGYLLIRAGKTAGIAGIPFYFLFMNFCIVQGFIRFLGKKQAVNWEKAQRQTSQYM